jgi:hypothetical protein
VTSSSATTANRQSQQDSDGYGKRFTTLVPIVKIPPTSIFTPNLSENRKEAVGKNIKWNEKLLELQ